MTIFAGPCLYIDDSQTQEILDTAKALKNIGIDYFRCKLWGGGTKPEKYYPGIGYKGLETLGKIREFMTVGTDISIPSQLANCENNLDYFWVGTRNSQNYMFLEVIKTYNLPFALKRGFGMPIDEAISIYKMSGAKWLIERGIITFDVQPGARYIPDLRGVLKIKYEEPEIFENLIIDCSHSVFDKRFVGDVYKAFKAIGVQHFMFECTLSGESVTDQNHMLSVKVLEKIIKE